MSLSNNKWVISMKAQAIIKSTLLVIFENYLKSHWLNARVQSWYFQISLPPCTVSHLYHNLHKIILKGLGIRDLKDSSRYWVRLPFGTQNNFSFIAHVSWKSIRANWLIAPEIISGFCSMKQLGVFLLPLNGMLVHRRSFPRTICRYHFLLLGGERHCES